MNLEDQLREALRRQDPPEGFVERVIQQAGSAGAPVRHPVAGWRFRVLWPAVSVAAAAVLVLSGSVEYRRAQEERAGRQAIFALQIASEKLNMAREVLNK